MHRDISALLPFRSELYHQQAHVFLLECGWLFLLPVFLLAAHFYYCQTEQGPSGPRDQRTL